jgi:hypothetical protein
LDVIAHALTVKVKSVARVGNEPAVLEHAAEVLASLGVDPVIVGIDRWSRDRFSAFTTCKNV